MCLRLAVVLLPCAVACCGMLLVLLSAVCAVVLCVPWLSVVRCAVTRLCGVVVLCLCGVLCNTAVALCAAERKIRKNFEFREMARLPFPGWCWKSGGPLCCSGLLVAEVARCSGLLVAAVACCSGLLVAADLLVSADLQSAASFLPRRELALRQ